MAREIEWTKEYRKEYAKKWRSKNKDKVRIYNQRYTKKYPEKRIEWRKKFLIRQKEYNKRFREKNPDYYTKKNLILYQKRIWYNLQRWVRHKNAKGSHTYKEWQRIKKKFNYICPMCGKQEPEIQLTEDHIIPLIKKGTNYLNNIQPLCINCNSKKLTKIIFFEPLKV